MKKILRFALVFVAVLSMSISFAQTNLEQAVDFTLTDVNGVTWNLFDELDSGKHVIIDFWAFG